MQYPTYQKLANAKAFYKIKNEKEFEELKIMGQKYCISLYVADQYPERVFIHDIMETGLKINESEYNSTVQECKSTLLKVYF